MSPVGMLTLYILWTSVWGGCVAQLVNAAIYMPEGWWYNSWPGLITLQVFFLYLGKPTLNW